MKTQQRKQLTRIMNAAWTLARSGAATFGGTAGMYFRIALRLSWQAESSIPVFTQGVGTQMWMGFVPLRQEVRKGQIALPGLVLK